MHSVSSILKHLATVLMQRQGKEQQIVLNFYSILCFFSDFFLKKKKDEYLQWENESGKAENL